MRDAVAAADMVEVVSARTALRRSSGSRYMGRCPFHEERTPSFSVNPVDKLYYCFGCGKGGDVVSFVRETENLDFVGAIEWLAERFRVLDRVRRVAHRAGRGARNGASGSHRRARPGGGVLRAASLGRRTAGEPVREYLAGRGIGDETAREFRLGLAPGRGLAQKARERGFTPDELQAAGLVNARGNDYFPQRLMFPLADARGRIVGFQARKLRDDDPLRGKYVNSPESELFHKSAILYGLHLARYGDRQAGPCARRRGEHRRDRAAPGGARAGRGVDGHCADRSPAARARPADAAALPLLRLGCRRRGGDPAGNGARGRRRVSTSASCRCRQGQDPADAPRGVRGSGSTMPRAICRTASAGARPLARPAGGLRPRARGARAGRGLARAPRRAAARSPTGSTCRARRSAGIAPVRAATATAPADASDAAARRGRTPRARRARGVRRAIRRYGSCSASSPPEHFDAELHRRFQGGTAGRRAPSPSSSRCAPSSTPRRSGKGLTSAQGRSCSCGCASAGCAATSMRRRVTSSGSRELQAQLARVRQALGELA